jgi:hypothetical protein
MCGASFGAAIARVVPQVIDCTVPVTNGGGQGRIRVALCVKSPPMQTSRGTDTTQRWRRPVEVGFWVVLLTLNVIFNSIDDRIDHFGRIAPWEPWVWETTSALVMLALLPAVIAAERRWPIRLDTWTRYLPLHLIFSVLFSLIHVLGMTALRRLAYAAIAGWPYRFGAWWINFGYEYLKDVRSYFLIIGVLMLYRLWRLRQQGEAKLLTAPDEGPPVEPIERPERFLVRKLGKEFLINASEIEWLQASGNYVNLHVRGRDYPMRSTMAGIETRLDAARFIRVHRGYFVNLDYLTEIEPLETGDALLRLRDGTTIPCSRRYRAALRERYGQAVAVE